MSKLREVLPTVLLRWMDQRSGHFEAVEYDPDQKPLRVWRKGSDGTLISQEWVGQWTGLSVVVDETENTIVVEVKNKPDDHVSVEGTYNDKGEEVDFSL